MSQFKLLIATRNPGKMREYAGLLRDAPFQLVSLDDLGITHEVEETGATFAENARLKASEYGGLRGLLTLADDSGLEVDALNGEPGVLSARYGEKSPLTTLYEKGGLEAQREPEAVKDRPHSLLTDQDRVNLLLKNLAEVPWERRTARFRCVLAIWTPRAAPAPQEGNLTLLVGSVAGMIQYQPAGGEGFGYDPVFYLPSYGLTMAQLPLEEKNRISHRANAVGRAARLLKGKVQ